jgi:predicted negative regulator of RcsB-dependent stress response
MVITTHRRWRLYGLILVLAVVTACAAIYNWRVQLHKQHQAAAGVYEQLLTAMKASRIEEVRQHAAVLEAQYLRTPYAALAKLILSKLAVEREEYAQAETYLRSILQQHKRNSKSALASLARLRLARVLATTGKEEQALTELAGINNLAFSSMVQEVKGDIHSKLHQYDAARQAYTQALAELGNRDTAWLEAKLSEVNSHE